MLAAKYHGVGTLGDLADYHRMKALVCKPLADELVEEGRLLAVEVRGWDRPAFMHPDAVTPRRVERAGAAEPVRPCGVEP